MPVANTNAIFVPMLNEWNEEDWDELNLVFDGNEEVEVSDCGGVEARFDEWIRMKDGDGVELVKVLLEEIKSTGLILPGGEYKVFEAASCIVANLYLAWQDKVEWVYYSRSHKDYNTKSRYRCSHCSITRIVPIIDTLEGLRYIIGRQGSKTVWRKDRVRSGMGVLWKLSRLFTSKMQVGRSEEEEVIWMREVGEKGRSFNVDYVDYYKRDKAKPGELVESRAIHFNRGRVKRINQFLGEQKIDLPEEMKDEVMGVLRAKYGREWAAGKFIKGAFFRQIALSRIYCQGEWDRGGRFYRGFWQNIPAKYRRFLTINGKSVVEVDYKCLHPRLAYAKHRINYIEDAYDLTEYGYGAEWRPALKIALNAMLCSDNKHKAVCGVTIAINRLFVEQGMKKVTRIEVERVFDAFTLKHKPIRKKFYTGAGVKLQCKDAQMTEEILLTLMGEGVPCLPIHDSYIVQAEHGDRVEQLMQVVYTKHTGQDALVERK